MSVKVNLLPAEAQARGQASRSRALLALLAVVLVAVLGGLTFLQRSTISERETELAAVQANNQVLQAEIAALQPFADLQARATSGVDLVATAMAREVGVASILQDLSAVLPPGVELSNISIAIAASSGSPSSGGVRPIEGTMSATGKVLGIAPGVERLLIDLGRVAAFDNVYVTSATTDENGVTTFELSVEFGDEVLTGRYVTAEVGQ